MQIALDEIKNCCLVNTLLPCLWGSLLKLLLPKAFDALSIARGHKNSSILNSISGIFIIKFFFRSLVKNILIGRFLCEMTKCHCYSAMLHEIWHEMGILSMVQWTFFCNLHNVGMAIRLSQSVVQFLTKGEEEKIPQRFLEPKIVIIIQS